MPEIRHRSHKKPSGFRLFLRQYRFEIIWLAVVALGVFLLFEHLNIRRTLLRWMGTAASEVFRGLGRLDNAVAEFLARTTLSDAIGYALILSALLALVLRIRWRLLRSPRATDLRCPRCGGAIHRVHRTGMDRMISLFVPVQRHRCTNRECRWQGLRVVGLKTPSAGGAPTVRA